jgi:mannose-1-phosphate guanylyltransferase
LNEFKTWMPELYEKIMTIQRVWGTARQSTVLHSVWPTIKPETIDYGIMEKAQKVVTIPAQNLRWNDVGSWESLFEVYLPDQNGMVSLAKKSLGIGSTSSLIYESLDDKIVTTLGIDNLIIIDTPDALMICTREKAQQIKEIINNLKEGHLEKYL